jgi:hypothetical protein
MNSVWRWSTVLVLAVAVAACGTGRTLVMELPAKKATFMSARVVEEQPTVAVPPEVLAKFETVLARKLDDASKGGFTAGEGLVIKYRFV